MKFRVASSYAKTATSDPDIKAEYQAIATLKNLKSATVAAMTDYLTLPELLSTHAQRFDGTIGFPVSIVLADNYKGKEMTVSMCNKDGTIIESGNASFVFGDSAWRYTTTVRYANSEGLMVKVSVKDRIGRVVVAEKVLNRQV